MEFFKRGARPAMMWLSLVLIPAAVLAPVPADKLGILLAFLGAIYGIRGWEKVSQGKAEELRQESAR